LSILSVFFIFFQNATFLIFFKIIFKKSLILSLENDPSAIMGQKTFDEDMYDFLLAVVAWRTAAA